METWNAKEFLDRFKACTGDMAGARRDAAILYAGVGVTGLYTAWNNGRSLGDIYQIYRLAKGLGISPAWLAFGEGAPPEKLPLDVPFLQSLRRDQQSDATAGESVHDGAIPSMNGLPKSADPRRGASQEAKTPKSRDAGPHKPAGGQAPSNRTSPVKRGRKR